MNRVNVLRVKIVHMLVHNVSKEATSKKQKENALHFATSYTISRFINRLERQLNKHEDPQIERRKVHKLLKYFL